MALVALCAFSAPSQGQRSLRDIDKGGKKGGKKGCKKETVIVDGLRRLRCTKSGTGPRIRNVTGADKKNRRQCTTTARGKRKCSWITYFEGHKVPRSQLSKVSLAKPSGDIWFYAVHHRKAVKVNIYEDDGDLNDSSLSESDEGFGCRRSQTTRAVDPRLMVILSRINDNWPGKRVQLVSGFRFQTNEGSRHYHAAAMDIKVPDVDAQEVYDYVETLDRGGMGIGIYPFAGFVHIDFRAPGEPSYRWKDISPKNYAERGKELSDRVR